MLRTNIVIAFTKFFTISTKMIDHRCDRVLNTPLVIIQIGTISLHEKDMEFFWPGFSRIQFKYGKI